MSCLQIFHSYLRGKILLVYTLIVKNTQGRFINHPAVTMISYFYKADTPRMSERNNQVRPRASDYPPVTDIGGNIYDGNISTYVPIITMVPESPFVTKSDIISTTK